MNTPLQKVSEIARSVSLTHKKAKPELIFLNTSDIGFGKFLHRRYTDVSRWPGQAKKSISKNDILFSEIRPANGRWAFVDFESSDYVVSTKLMVIRVDERAVLPKYFYTWLTSTAIVDRLQGLAESRSGTFPQNQTCHEKCRSARVNVIIRDGTRMALQPTITTISSGQQDALASHEGLAQTQTRAV